VLFSLWVAFTSGYQAVYQAMLLLLIGIPIYAFLKARRERLGLVAAPKELRASEQVGDSLIVPPRTPPKAAA
jgi:hypothetical protein